MSCAKQTLDCSTFAQLMPMFLSLDAQGVIQGIGPTLAKLMGDRPALGARFFDAFALKRPAGLTRFDQLQAAAGTPLRVTLANGASPTLRGMAVATDSGGMIVNLAFGIGVVDAVRKHGLTDADFAPTDMAVEMLYLVEVKTAVVQELRHLNLRLQGAKVAAEEQAVTDTLTGLRNRRGLDAVLPNLIEAGCDFGMMHIDLDFFKQINDTLGHAAGDAVLREVGVALREETRSTDFVARVGGDEFVAVLPGLSDPQTLAQIAERIIDHLIRPIDFQGHQCMISASIGLTISTFYDAPDPEQMLRDADAALYNSKHAGRGQAQFHVPQNDGRLTA